MEWRGWQEMGLVKCLSCACRAVSLQSAAADGTGDGLLTAVPFEEWLGVRGLTLDQGDPHVLLGRAAVGQSRLSLHQVFALAVPSARGGLPLLQGNCHPSYLAVTWRLDSFPSAAERPPREPNACCFSPSGEFSRM